MLSRRDADANATLTCVSTHKVSQSFVARCTLQSHAAYITVRIVCCELDLCCPSISIKLDALPPSLLAHLLQDSRLCVVSCLTRSTGLSVFLPLGPPHVRQAKHKPSSRQATIDPIAEKGRQTQVDLANTTARAVSAHSLPAPSPAEAPAPLGAAGGGAQKQELHGSNLDGVVPSFEQVRKMRRGLGCP